ncbi:MAG TPA: endonuclease III [Candidatus Nanoarchaeia archaeon]|nr:endonuclease III [Candidatus Nanoarchaeia archaeon]
MTAATAKAEQAISILKKEYPNTKYYLNFSSPVQLLVATILSAQCRDDAVNATTARLFNEYKTAADFVKLEEDDIKSLTLFKNKAKYVREACRLLVEKHSGEAPDTMEELLTLPGVGRKTANAILINAFDKVQGVVVDTHVLRVGYRLGLTKNTNPEKVEKDLMAEVPKEEWKRITWLMKDHGRAVCKAPVPYCSKCILNNICPKNGVNERR